MRDIGSRWYALKFWEDVGTDSNISDMSYEREGSLGTPSIADYDRLEWQALRECRRQSHPASREDEVLFLK